MKAVLIFLCTVFFMGCDHSPTEQEIVTGVKGQAGQQTSVEIHTQSNPFGYYEYLPEDFNNQKTWPIIFYWNGANAISGNGKDEITNLLTQGLPQFINEGRHYPAIIISGMLPNWQTDDVHDFVEYIFTRYNQVIDYSRVYMTGFSAGGGVTVRYVNQHPEKFAAILPVAPAVQLPDEIGVNPELSSIASWFFHNSGDMKVGVLRSNYWHNALKELGGERRITRPDSDSHYAWQAAYSSKETWAWLFSQTKQAVK